MLKLQATSQAEVWKILKNMQPAHTRAIPDLNGRAELVEKCAALRKALFPPPTSGDDIPALRPPATELREEFSEITSTEVSRAIDRCNKRSPSGQDKIPVHSHRKSPSPPAVTARPLRCLDQDRILSEDVETCQLCGHPEGRTMGPHPPKSYRPTSLLSSISKVFEKLIAKCTADAALRVKALSST